MIERSAVAPAADPPVVPVCVSQVLQMTELIEEPKYKTNKLRVQNRKQLIPTLSERYTHTYTQSWCAPTVTHTLLIISAVCSARLLQQTTCEWLGQFEGSGVPVGPINSMQEVFSDPQVIYIHSFISFSFSYLFPNSFNFGTFGPPYCSGRSFISTWSL